MKTGVRFVWPLFPEWAEKWQLDKRTWPPLANIPGYAGNVPQVGEASCSWIFHFPVMTLFRVPSFLKLLSVPRETPISLLAVCVDFHGGGGR
jgi:hypothetical protein